MTISSWDAMRLRLWPRLWLAAYQASLTIVSAGCVILSLAYLRKFALALLSGSGGGRIGVALGSVIVLAVFGMFLVFLVPSFVRFPVVLCAAIRIGDNSIEGVTAGGRLLINRKWLKVNAVPARGPISALLVFPDAGRMWAFELPLSLFHREDQVRLLRRFENNRPPVQRRYRRLMRDRQL